MKVLLKTNKEIETMAEGGRILKTVADEVVTYIKPGVTTNEIDAIADKLISKNGAEASFKKVRGYNWATCLPVNEQAVHTPPSSRTLKIGDIVTLDIGVYYRGFHTDYAVTVAVGKVDDRVTKFLETGKETLEKAITMVKNDEYLGTVSKFVQTEVESNGYFILKDLTGHGIGRSLHEDPYVLNYLDREVEKTYKIRSGLVIALEIIYSIGTEQIAYEQDNHWSIVAADRSLAACFERTIAVSDKKTFILT
ncbi:type I methionyl aminopeptidase [Candidatus Roizmanbacteria bacterium RIFCSPLOWO2_01_FULL_38_12]|uniref:Methionine aminopeptidase n=1 Tax=Candidatus Roizmanbacteria bacterium RIFCSPLOWO2_01_FULL_38_12 TaxID=1802061 RepID=A0A1F7IXZ8_9BACT|nr:MAG: type I methionyl aminopeptidase [Candidatus Roizmanbacteria bacterium RIFCSPHIGHO2_01_FULL_38_15]OGK35884.1 MAG: type I methionyl aminopeptidase [Candidatus Roizmanbacteria bacterium RIFCSPHIGHO2_12_FULL_38_13]OGK48250.1 MAG: type I methionyl aminopeptidase [Candidatus Roizmanbacteria bacterium RIFCSPLOWO2_01_FULL_38_12]